MTTCTKKLIEKWGIALEALSFIPDTVKTIKLSLIRRLNHILALQHVCSLEDFQNPLCTRNIYSIPPRL